MERLRGVAHPSVLAALGEEEEGQEVSVPLMLLVVSPHLL